MRLIGTVLAVAAGLLVASCTALSTPAPTQAEQCQAWGYAPNDPECLRVFHRDRAALDPLTAARRDG